TPQERRQGTLQGRPAVVHPLLLDQEDLLHAHAEVVRDHPPRLLHRHPLVLGIHKGRKDFLLAGFRKNITHNFTGYGLLLLLGRRATVHCNRQYHRPPRDPVKETHFRSRRSSWGEVTSARLASART